MKCRAGDQYRGDSGVAQAQDDVSLYCIHYTEYTAHYTLSTSLFCIKYTVKSLFVSDLDISEQDGKHSALFSSGRVVSPCI